MKRFSKVVTVAGVLAVVCVLGAAALQEKKVAVFTDSAKAKFQEVIPGVQKAVIWGDPDKGAYGAFTKFAPAVNNALHTHTNDVRIVVIQGAYLYKPEKGEERRVGAGCFLFVPGGDRHVSGGDPKEGAMFYEESTGKFDTNFVEKK